MKIHFRPKSDEIVEKDKGRAKVKPIDLIEVISISHGQSHVLSVIVPKEGKYIQIAKILQGIKPSNNASYQENFSIYNTRNKSI